MDSYTRFSKPNYLIKMEVGNDFSSLNEVHESEVHAQSDTSWDSDVMDLRSQKRDRYRQDTSYRRYFAIWVMVIVPVWLASILVLVYLDGFDKIHINDPVFIAFLTNSTATVLGLAYIVLKGIFDVNKK